MKIERKDENEVPDQKNARAISYVKRMEEAVAKLKQTFGHEVFGMQL